MQRCIVIADDDPTIIDLVRLRLGMARYDVICAGDAPAAVALVQARKPAAVILDVQMPGGGDLPGGLSALSAIKSDPRLSALPVMMLTGERDPGTVMQAMSSGADDYMIKPFHPDVLLDRVSRLVKSSAMVWPGAAAAPGRSPVWEI